jgi:D-glycero-alpha-D-manno-heptose-7-phosphate kinase
MLISKTPFRISFFGGGTDYPAWYLKEGGAVLSTTIDKYCYITCRLFPPFFDQKYRVVWSHIENVSSVSEILHPAVREGLKFLGMEQHPGIEIHHQGDLPARAGMGSSSSFAVGLIKVLTVLQDKKLNKHEIALKAIELEQSILKEHVGDQDQVAAAYGGFNQIHFHKNGGIHVDPVEIDPAKKSALEDRLMLFYTGTNRIASKIAGQVILNLHRKKTTLKKMHQKVEEALNILQTDKDLDDFGRLLNENWLLKRSISDVVSNERIDRIYKKAIENGALGGKLLGAGSSGFLLFYVPPEKQKNVKTALIDYLYVPFKFENQGSIIF